MSEIAASSVSKHIVHLYRANALQHPHVIGYHAVQHLALLVQEPGTIKGKNVAQLAIDLGPRARRDIRHACLNRGVIGCAESVPSAPITSLGRNVPADASALAASVNAAC